MGLSGPGLNGERLRSSAKAGGYIVRRDEVKGVAIPAKDIAKLCVADADSVLQHGRKYRLKIARRATDDLKHLRRRRLLLQRFGEVVGALP